MKERSDKELKYLKSYIVEIAMLEFIKENGLINEIEYEKLKKKITGQYKNYNILNNSNNSFE